MQQPDKQEFIKSMEKEIADQLSNGNFSMVLRSQVPKRTNHSASSVANEKEKRYYHKKGQKMESKIGS